MGTSPKSPFKLAPETIEKNESFANLESCNEKEDYFQILSKIWKYFKENKATDQYTTEENKNKNTTILNWEDIPIVTYQELLLDYSATAQQKNPNGSLSDGILSNSLIQEIEVEEIKDLNDNNQEQMELPGAYHKDLEKNDDRTIYEGGDMELTETNEDHLERNNNQNVNAPFGAFLDWPKTPQRKNKRQIKKSSYIITSTCWKKAQKEEKDNKEREETEKNNRKLARLAKQE
ncbi:hypothetical protein QE152_g39262 [Popillia japonica]|uniref:Uncharacterized protein n=1 Tax=Popillia japonica TaxID=7064 RepID=A0AAW1HV35_POPJA